MRLRSAFLSVAMGLGPSVVAAAQSPRLTSAVLLAPAMQRALESTYGPAERPVLERTIREPVDAALPRAGCGTAAQVEITLVDARPTHPTDRQIGDNPSLDRILSRYVGGATFSVRLLDAARHELKSLRYRWYAQDTRHGSLAVGPWGDVRLASEGLGSELARTCRALARNRPPSP